MMMDSYSRTKSGFQSLIQKEWVIGGHSFLDRCNHLHKSEKEEVWFFHCFPYLLFISLISERRDLAVSPEVPVTLRIFCVLFYGLMFVQSHCFCCLEVSNGFIIKENKCKIT